MFGKSVSSLALVLFLGTGTPLHAQSQTVDIDELEPLVVIGARGRVLFSHIADYVTVSEDSLYILDRNEPFIYLYNLEGKLKLSFGTEGQGPGELIKPAAIDYYNGYLYVLDDDPDRIHVYNNRGGYIRTIYLREQMTDICVNMHGIYVSVKSMVNVLYYIPHGRDTHQQPILAYESLEELASVPQFNRLGSPKITCTDNHVVIAMPHTGNIICHDINNNSFTCIVPDIVKEPVRSMRREWESGENVSLPVHIKNLFHSISLWDDNRIILSLTVEIGRPYWSHAIIISYSDDNDVSYPAIISRRAQYSQYARYGDVFMVYNYDDATFQIRPIVNSLIQP